MSATPRTGALLCCLVLTLSIRAQDTILPPAAEFSLDVLRPRVSLRHDVGDGVGYDHGFTYLQAWIPIRQRPGSYVLFTDLRAVNFDNAYAWEYNGGGGFRYYSERWDRILGANVYYDGRDTAQNFFHQIGIGVESLGRYLDFRANAYLPIGQNRQVAFDGGTGNPAFSGFNITLDRTLVYDVAMRGFDAEVGTPIPYLQRWDARAFIGGYHYTNETGPDANGVRGRLEARPSDRLSLHFSVQHDDVFRTTLNGGVAFHFGGRRLGGERRAPGNRLDERVVRDVNIVLSRNTEVTKELALDPKTGQPIVVKHANSNAAAGGDGTVERPFQTLTALQGGSGPSQILFLHAGSTFTNQPLVLQNNQRLLGEGISHLFTARQGTFLLPRATTNTALPLLVNTVAASESLTLAMNNEVSGLNYNGAAATTFIFGTGNLGTFSINRNSITGGNVGVDLLSVTGNGSITSNAFANSMFGIRTNQSTGDVTQLIDRNTFASTNQFGVIVTLTNGSVNQTISRNTFASSNACVQSLQTGGTFYQVVNGNTFTNSFNGVFMEPRGGTATVVIDRNTFTNNLNGVVVLQDTGGSLLLGIRSNSFSGSTIRDVSDTLVSGTPTQCLVLQNNVGTPGYAVSNFSAGTLMIEDVLGTNTPMPVIVGPFTLVPAGSCGLP